MFGNTTGATLGGTGAATGGFGGFGATNTTGQAGATSGGLFGQKPATTLGGGLFGNTAGGATLGGGLGTSGGGFGGFGQQQAGVGTFNLPAQGGLTSFGTNALQPGQQPLVATVDKNPYGNNPLFDLSKSTGNAVAKLGPSAIALDSRNKTTSSPHYPISPRVVSKIKLRGFSFPSATANSSGKIGGVGRKNLQKTGLDGLDDDAILGSGAFAPRTGNKRLVFDTNVDTANIVALVNDKKKLDKRRVIFNPDLETMAHNPTSAAGPSTSTTIATSNNNDTTTSTAATAVTTSTTITTTTTTTTSAASATTNSASASSVAIKNGYYMSPTLEVLTSMTKENLKHVQNLIVGRKGYGEVKFEGSVDLSNIILDDLMGNIVVIEDKKVVVYPKEDTKAPKGTELNVPAFITLENCFSHDKNTGAAIRDKDHPRFQLFKEKLKKRPGVEFVSYGDETGAWTFKVMEF